MVKLKRISKHEVKFIPNSSEELKLIMKKLTFFVEGAVFSQKYRDGFWDGKKRYFRNKNEISFGLTKYVCEFLDEEGISYELEDFEKFNSDLDISEIKLSDGLRPHQIEGTLAFFNNKFGPHGICKIPTRGGKTFTAAECIRIARLKGHMTSVFLVDGIDLFKQTVEEFAKFFKIEESEIGQLQGSGVWEFKEINVATVQTLQRILFPGKEKGKTVVDEYGEKIKVKRKKSKLEKNSDSLRKIKLEKLMRDVSFLIIDEVQEYSSDSRLGTIRKFKNVVFMLSLSATPFRSEDELGNLSLREVVGDVIYEVPEDELIKSGSLVKNKVLIISFEDEIKLGDTYLEYYEENIIKNETRNNLIFSLTKILSDLSIKSLFMITRKDHGHMLSEKSGVIYVSGDDDSDDRQKIKSEFLDKKDGILFASNIYKKGVSLNNVQVLVNVSGGKEKSAIIQKRGRVLASVDGKSSALIVDIFDQKPYLNEHSENRLQAYVDKVGEENIIILDYKDPEFIADIEYIIEDYFNE